MYICIYLGSLQQYCVFSIDPLMWLPWPLTRFGYRTIAIFQLGISSPPTHPSQSHSGLCTADILFRSSWPDYLLQVLQY